MPAPKTEEDKLAELRRQEAEAKRLAQRWEPIHNEIQAVLQYYRKLPQR